MAPHEDRPLTPDEVARLLHVCKRTLCRYRQTGDGPRWIRVGKRLVRYQSADVRSYLEAAANGGAMAAAA